MDALDITSFVVTELDEPIIAIVVILFQKIEAGKFFKNTNENVRKYFK